MADLSLLTAIHEVIGTTTKQVTFHGEKATEVTAHLADGRTVTGTFTTEDKDSFGGVKFSSRKDIGALMAAKVRNVLDGTAEHG